MVKFGKYKLRAEVRGQRSEVRRVQEFKMKNSKLKIYRAHHCHPGWYNS
jgi:hypothetical protein